MDAAPGRPVFVLGSCWIPSMDGDSSFDKVMYPRKRRGLSGDVCLEMIDKDGDVMSVKAELVGGVWLHRQGYTIVGTPLGCFAVNHTYDEIMNLVAPYEEDVI